MEKRQLTWGRQPVAVLPTPSEKGQSLPRERPTETTLHTGAKTTYTGNGRSAYACRVYPDLTPMDAGKRVARDIQSDPRLWHLMKAAGYIPNKRGYSEEQLEILNAYYYSPPSPRGGVRRPKAE